LKPKINDHEHSCDILKKNTHYWDEWTGSRFVRIENPDIFKNGNTVKSGSVCYADPVTGKWKERV